MVGAVCVFTSLAVSTRSQVGNWSGSQAVASSKSTESTLAGISAFTLTPQSSSQSWLSPPCLRVSVVNESAVAIETRGQPPGPIKFADPSSPQLTTDNSTPARITPPSVGMSRVVVTVCMGLMNHGVHRGMISVIRSLTIVAPLSVQ